MKDEIPTPTDAADRHAGAEPDRTAQPVDAEAPPRLPFPVVGVGASAGGIEAFGEFLAAMRPDGGMAFVFVLHLPPDAESHLAEVLAPRTAMPVRQVADGMPVEVNHVYVIRPGHVLTIVEGRLRLGPELGGPRAANRPVDDFLRSLAEEQRERAVCVVLSGMGSNGTAGAQAVKAVGGLCVAQDPDSARYPSMPRHLVDAGYADHILRPAEIPAVLLAYAGSPYASGGREDAAGPVLDREGHHLREVLAVLRTRTRHDFGGYKKPTVLRRVQRRMGLARTDSLAEYARLLRQTPAEVTALADDLLIHVTGFFRDPEAWEALRQRVIVPLVAGREPGAAVRAWVAACSSGEEAYSLAILLVEEAERAGRPLDIKVFATDLADRTLAHARAGIYPGGIESDLSRERLGRFFAREAEHYRVRPDLRDRVVFAPQDILQDPPFSRLDIATCRNLLIYLEPDMQRRVLSLLHFGLRVGGALFLGSAETVGGAEGLFEPVDKKARIYRRVGPTRHGAVEFPLPHPVAAADAGATRSGGALTGPWPADGPSASVAGLTRQALLDAHTPPAVTVDRDGQVVYFAGDAAPFLRMSGEPTRELVLLAREGVRAAARKALQRAAAEGTRVTVPDGWVDRDLDRRHRVAVTASPVADPAGGDRPPAYFVVSFDDRGELPAPAPDGHERRDEEVRRLRGELQGVIEELQSSNEELRAANEEVTSVNEELQSANEELLTSKEEMQSLNEELTTVNAQLRLKMEEHQAASSDLASLLASTDIAVLFLDTTLRIRRFTPAARDLIDLIPGDVGRPLAALARRFDDPHLDLDCAAVLEKLVPVAREVPAAGGRGYLRRVLPYRTTDNRIDGVVVTFVDVTDRTRAEAALRDSEERQAFLLELSDALRTVREPAGILAAAVRIVAEHLGVVRALYFEVGPDQDWGTFTANSEPGSSLPIRAPLSAFGDEIAAGLQSGRTISVEDTRLAGGSEGQLAAWHAIDAHAWVAVPLVKDGRLVAVHGVHNRAPRAWTQAEIQLLEEVAERTWAAVERARAEAALRASEERYRTLFESMDEAYTVVEVMRDEASGRWADFRFLEVNPAFVKHTGMPYPVGRTASELLGTPNPRWAEIYGRVAETGEPIRLEEREPSLDRVFDLYIFRLGGPGSRRVAVLFTDVSPRKRAEEALRQSNVRFQSVANLVPDLLWASRPDGYTDWYNQRWSEYTGQTFEQAIGWGWTDAIHPDDREGSASRYTEAVESGRALVQEHRIRRSDGEYRWFLVRAEPVRDEAGHLTMFGSATDIHAQRTMIGALRESEGRLRAVAEGLPNAAAFVVDADLRYTLAAGEAMEAAGFTPASLEGRTVGEVMEPELAAEYESYYRRALAGEPFRTEHRSHGRYYVTHGTPLRDHAGQVTAALAVSYDITDRKEAEETLRRAEERLRLALAAARTGTWEWSVAADEHRRDANLNALLGLPPEETVRPFAEFLAHIHPDDRGAVRAAFDQSVRHGRPLDTEFRVVRPDGSTRWLRDQGDVFGTAGQARMTGACVDVTDLKDAEAALRRANDLLEARVRERTAELAAANATLLEALAARTELLRRLSTAQEDERRRLSRELHDGLGQGLTALILGLKALERAVPEGAPGRDRLLEVERIVGGISREAHDLAVELRPTALDDLGLEPALSAYVARWSERSGVAATFQSIGLDGERLPPEVETAVYRVVQEALNNVAKHAEARRVGVMVARELDELVALVEDDGRGFDPEWVVAGAGRRSLGLLGMRERVGLVGGTLVIESGEGEGTVVQARIPMPRADGEAPHGG